MSSNVKVEEATTQKKPYKFGYLNELITDQVEYKKIVKDIYAEVLAEYLQRIEDADGCYIQSLLWFNDLCMAVENLTDGMQEEDKDYMALLNLLNVLMVENDLEFIFI